ncbi:hypothetical protein D3C81_1373320 [compost metagenome]
MRHVAQPEQGTQRKSRKGHGLAFAHRGRVAQRQGGQGRAHQAQQGQVVFRVQRLDLGGAKLRYLALAREYADDLVRIGVEQFLDHMGASEHAQAVTGHETRADEIHRRRARFLQVAHADDRWFDARDGLRQRRIGAARRAGQDQAKHEGGQACKRQGFHGGALST